MPLNVHNAVSQRKVFPTIMDMTGCYSCVQAALREVQQQLQAEREHRSRLEQQLQGPLTMPRERTQDAAAQASPSVSHCSIQTGIDEETPGVAAANVDNVEAAVETANVNAAVEADCVAGEW